MFASLTDDWRFAGLTAVLTDQEIVTSAMAILPDIRKKVELRRILRHGRRYRKNRRRKARWKDTKKAGWISPTQRAKVEFRLTLVGRYLKLYPIIHFAVEDVKFNHYKKRWGKHFSGVEIGKTLLYTELEKLGKLYKFEGWQTKQLRDRDGLKKSSSKDKLSFDSSRSFRDCCDSGRGNRICWRLQCSRVLGIQET